MKYLSQQCEMQIFRLYLQLDYTTLRYLGDVIPAASLTMLFRVKITLLTSFTKLLTGKTYLEYAKSGYALRYVTSQILIDAVAIRTDLV